MTAAILLVALALIGLSILSISRASLCLHAGTVIWSVARPSCVMARFVAELIGGISAARPWTVTGLHVPAAEVA